MADWAHEQPKDGDVVLTCGHEQRAGKWRWFKILPSEVHFKRPDGTKGIAGWIVACPACSDRADGDITKIKIRGDGTWTGNEPVIASVN